RSLLHALKQKCRVSVPGAGRGLSQSILRGCYRGSQQPRYPDSAFREKDHKHRARRLPSFASDPTRDPDTAIVLGYNFTADPETEPGAGGFFRCEKGLKNARPRLRRHAAAIIHDEQPDTGSTIYPGPGTPGG